MKYGAESGQSGATNIVKLPLAFVRSGYVGVNTGSVNYVGDWWSRTATSATHAYRLIFYPTNVVPSDSYGRFHAFPLRCLYPGNN